MIVFTGGVYREEKTPRKRRWVCRWRQSGFDCTETGIKARHGAAALLGFLSQLSADALKGVANRVSGRRHILIAVVNFQAVSVCLRGVQLVHSCLPLTILVWLTWP